MRRPSLDELTSAECWARLSTGSLGRISVTVAALPVVVPVFYAVMDESIVFRCPPRTRLAAATTRSVVAFEVGEYADETGHGWSVMAQGVASSITSPAVLERARQLPLAPMGGEVLGLLTLAVHAQVPTAVLRRMIYAYPTFHRAIEATLDEL